jgi:UDP-2,3-diacylglucosamine pyrophosphatase LpxH
MIVVISDLHFEEEAADTLRAAENGVSLARNVPAKAFAGMIRDVLQMARDNEVGRIELILAGDIFDLHRTQLWFAEDSGLRPYVNCDAVASGSALEAKILAILEAIAAEKEVAGSLAIFRDFAANRLVEGSAHSVELETELHYFPGNHDRLADATPAIRSRVRQLLGLAADCTPFEHQILFADPPVLIRHGHEYDRYNFAADLRGSTIPVQLPTADYGRATFGDFVTTMIASRLPYCYRQKYTDAGIIEDSVLRAVYCRLLQFDDVRPQSAVVSFFLDMVTPRDLREAFSSRQAWQKKIWSILEPIVRRLVDEVSVDGYFRGWSRRLAPWYLRPLLPALLWLRPWRYGISFWAVKLVSLFMNRAPVAADGPSLFAAREKALRDGPACFVVAGHTHKPQVAHVFTRQSLKKYFVDTGTWRNAVLRATVGRSYGRLNAATFVAFYGADPDKPSAGAKTVPRGLEYWSGYLQNWPVDVYDR